MHNAISNNGGTAVYVTDGGVAQIKANAGADGNGPCYKCFDGGAASAVMQLQQENSPVVYMRMKKRLDTTVTVNGDITVSGDNSRISVSGENLPGNWRQCCVSGNGASGISASGGNYDDTYMV